MQYYRARSLSEFEIEKVGEDRVLFDRSALQYHTLSRDAFMIWRGLNGLRSEEDVAESVYGDRSDVSVARVHHAIALLAENGLLEEVDPEAPSFLTRRAATKLAAAGLAGMMGLPVVKSITVPDAVSAGSVDMPPIPNDRTCPTDLSQPCESDCCCTGGGEYGLCLDSFECTRRGYSCSQS
jgi:hypothetical protein